MSVWQISLICTVLACICVFLRSAAPQLSSVFSLCCVVWLLFLFITKTAPVILYAQQLAQASSYGEYMPYIIKSLSIGISGNICCEFCKDAGQLALANVLQGVCKAAILVLCLPLIKEIAQVALSYV